MKKKQPQKSGKPRQQVPPQPRRPGFPVKTAALALAGVALVAGYSLWIRDFLWFRLDSDLLAFFMPLIWAGLVLAAALPITRVLTTLVLAPPRTETHRGEEGVDKSLFQPRVFIWSGVFVATVAGLFVLAWTLSRVPGQDLVLGSPVPLKDVAPREQLSALLDQQEISLLAMARSRDPEEVKRFLSKASQLRRSDEVALAAPYLLRLVQSPDKDLAVAACEALATLGERMSRNVSILAEKKLLGRGRWEPLVLGWLRKDVTPFLLAEVQKRAELESGVLTALAWIANEDDGDLLAAALLDGKNPDELRIIAATGLGNLQRDQDVALLAGLLDQPISEALTLRVLWALKRSGLTSSPDSLSPIPEEALDLAVRKTAGLLPTGSPALRCAAIQVLLAFEDSRVTEELISFFESPESDLTCSHSQVERPWGPPMDFVPESDLRFEVLNLFATIAVDNYPLYKWVELASQKDHWKPSIKAGLVKIFSELNQAR